MERAPHRLRRDRHLDRRRGLRRQGVDMAFTMAQGAAVVPDSPVPLTPSGLVVQTASWWSTVMAGTSAARGIA
jgi:hypothetical protein